MHYEGNIIRPPSEANSILLQVTVGCSHNKCTFCGTYAGERFKIKPDDVIMADIAFAAQYCKRQRRLFLCDGDALIIPQKRLAPLLTEIKDKLPRITRVGAYANVKSLKTKSLEDLRKLKRLGLGIIYMGLESGDDKTLENVRKEGDRAAMIEQAHKVLEAGIKLNVTVMLGLAGLSRSNVHAIQTGEALSEMGPNHLAALTFIPVPGTPLFKKWKAGDFMLPDPMQMLSELRTILKHTHLSKGLFLSNHASNYLPLRVRLPRGKKDALKLLDKALAGNVPLTPERMRAL